MLSWMVCGMFQLLCVVCFRLFDVLSQMFMMTFMDAFDLYCVSVILQIAVIFGQKAATT